MFVQRIASQDTVIFGPDLEQVDKFSTENPEKESIKLPQAGSDHLRLLTRVGIVDPNSLEDYKTHGG